MQILHFLSFHLWSVFLSYQLRISFVRSASLVNLWWKKKEIFIMCSPEMSQCRLSRLPQWWRLCSRIVLKILSAIRRRIFVVQEFLHFFLKVWNCQLFFIINFMITTQSLFLCRIFRTPTFATLFLGTTWMILKSTGKIKSGAEIHTTYMMLYTVNCMKKSAIKLNCPFYFQWALNCTTFTAFIDDPDNCDCLCVAVVRPIYGNNSSVQQ